MASQKVKYRYRNRPKKRRSGRRKMTIPVAVVAGFIPLVSNTISQARSGNLAGVTKTIVPYDPVSGRMTWSYLGQGLIPIVIGFLVHKAAGMIGVNRMLSQANVPLIRL